MSNLLEVIVLLAIAVVVVPIFQFLRVGAVLGFIVAGALVGPSGFGLIDDVEQLRHFSELGVVFLLFIIGVELRPARLWLMRRMVFGLGTAQVLLTGAVLFGIAKAGGFSTSAALLIGLALALSSTAFVIQLLAERRELNTGMGRHAFAVLLMQDLAVVPLLALVTVLARPEGPLSANLPLAIFEAVAIVVAVVVAGHFLLRPLLHTIAAHGSDEIFAASGLLLVLGTAWLMDHAGMSMAMGAFVAGLLIADSEYRHQIMADIQPFRGLLLGLFFMAVGMSVDLRAFAAEPVYILSAVAVLVFAKSVVLSVLLRVFGLETRDAVRGGLFLAQGGEFAFVLFGAATAAGLMSSAQFSRLAMVVALSMAVTPLLALAADRIRRAGGTSAAPPPLPVEDKPHVIIAGFGRVGRRISRMLTRAGVPCVAVDRNPDKVRAGRAEGLNVYFGDASRADVLFAAAAERASMVIVTLDSLDAAKRLVGAIRASYPDLPLYARGHDRIACADLKALGANGVVSENLEASIQLTTAAFERSGVETSVWEGVIQEYREDYYDEVPPANLEGCE